MTTEEKYQKLKSTLEYIASQKNMTLIAPSLGTEGDRAHQIGANKAFNQLGYLAEKVLAEIR